MKTNKQAIAFPTNEAQKNNNNFITQTPNK